jgi:hypothetical protein
VGVRVRVTISIVCGAVAFLGVCLTDTPCASAQDYWDRHDAAQRQINSVERDQRFELAASQCQDSIERRQAQWMVTWCDLAAKAAMRQRNHDRRRDYSEAERDLLWNAAWLQALEGIQQGSFFAAPLVERVSIADESSNRRFIAYRLLSNLRSRDYRDIEANLRQLGSLDGITIGPSESMLVGRRQLINALLAGPRTPERLWAIAAAALTYELEYYASEVSREQVIADAREVALLLEGVTTETDDLSGQDAALTPLLLYAQTKTLWVARDYEGGQHAGQRGYESCVTRLWASASICLDLGLEAAFSGLLYSLTTADPAMMELPPEPPLSSRERGVEYTEARCRVLIVGDIDDAGGFVNVRTPYENPSRVCRSMALSYAAARNYRPVAQAVGGMRRQNIIIRFVLTSP